MKQAVPVKVLISLYECMRDLHTCAWFSTLEKVVVDLLLGTSYICLCMWCIFPTERESRGYTPVSWGNTHVSTEVDVAPGGGRPRRCHH